MSNKRILMCGAAVIAGVMAIAAARAAQETGKVDTIITGKAHDALFALAFNQNIGVAVGAAGAIFDTRDAGKTWQRVSPSPTQLSLLGVDINAAHELAVGQMGLILKRDAQAAWQKVDSGTEERLFAVSLNSHGVAAAVGSFGTVLKSSDGGGSWAAIAPDWSPYTEDGAQPHLYGVDVDEAGSVTIAGEFGLILRSAAGQAGWQLLHKGAASIFALDIRSDGVGYAVGQSGAALRSDNGGQTWSELATGSAAILLGVRSSADGQVVASGMRDMLRSADNGQTWSHVTAGDVQSAWYSGLARADAGAPLLAVGATGKIIRIDN
ncbi:MAG: hypothetical protein JWQ90_3740 [Hydrocarboniphaga sp.]|uniref:WD40/YVTN/BNR-like repeat-containing protein n=1 Tax=Hydrocarboniphaga sp. TaxID=2033016 RepID=UPI002609B383|nr:YCF48-related protein [Hydrocarboniphaga sp.]MDB5971290.1 hypothetical protein [Hydrocarboniphaga sp.]